MEAALESEYDVLFADLNKQISLLIMDDDDEHGEELIAHRSSLNPQVFARSIHPERSCSKGTGVFIPRSSFPRRRNTCSKQGRFNNKFQQRPSLDQKSRGLSHVAYNNNNNNNNISPSYYDSSNLRRY